MPTDDNSSNSYGIWQSFVGEFVGTKVCTVSGMMFAPKTQNQVPPEGFSRFEAYASKEAGLAKETVQ